MKSVVIFVMYAGLVTGLGCKGRGPVNPLNCSVNAQKVTEASLNYSKSQTVANCEAYKREVIAFIQSCPAFYSGTTKQEMEEFANMPCE